MFGESWLSGRRLALALGAIVALAAALRFSTLSLQSYWYDEADTALLVSGSFGHMLHLIPSTEASPPLYYVLAWLWARVFGNGEVGLRAFSALCGTGFVVVAFLIGRRLAGAAAGLATALLAAVAPFAVWYSQEARDYSLLTLLLALSLLSFIGLLAGEQSARKWIAWTAWSALALATHYFAALLIAPMAAWLVLARLRRGEPAADGAPPADQEPTADGAPPADHQPPPGPRAVVVSLGALALVAAALAPLALHQHGMARQAIIGSLQMRALQLPKQLLVGYHSPGDRELAVVCAVIVAGALVAVLRSARVRARALPLLALLVASLVLIAVLAAAGLDYLDSRNMIGLIVPLIVLTGTGLAVARHARAGAAALAVLTAIGVAVVIDVNATPSAQRDDWRGAIEALGTPLYARAIVVTPGQGSAPFAFYLPDARPLGGAAGARVVEIDIVGMAARGSGETPIPPAPRVPALPGSFTLLALERSALYTIERFRAPVAVAVSQATLAAARLTQTQPLLYVQAAG
jgi:hypothetical protein